MSDFGDHTCIGIVLSLRSSKLFSVILLPAISLLQLLNAVAVGTVARFLPVIFNQLFHILVVTGNEDVSLNVVRYVSYMR